MNISSEKDERDLLLFFSFLFFCTSMRSLLSVSNLGIFMMMIILTSCFMMGKGPNGEWELSQNVGLDSAVTSKVPFSGNVPTLGFTLHLSQPASSFVRNFRLLQKFGFLCSEIQ
jgi:hypothetical protein